MVQDHSARISYFPTSHFSLSRLYIFYCYTFCYVLSFHRKYFSIFSLPFQRTCFLRVQVIYSSSFVSFKTPYMKIHLCSGIPYFSTNIAMFIISYHIAINYVIMYYPWLLFENLCYLCFFFTLEIIYSELRYKNFIFIIACFH